MSTDNHLSISINSNINTTYSVSQISIFTLNEFKKEFRKIPKPIRPFLKMTIRNAPKPKNGIKIKIFSKKYKITFNDKDDWEYFKKTMLKLI